VKVRETRADLSFTKRLENEQLPGGSLVILEQSKSQFVLVGNHEIRVGNKLNKLQEL